MAIPPTAVVETKDIGEGVEVGPFTWIGPNVQLEDGVRIGAHCSIGGDPEHKSRIGNGFITIGLDSTLHDRVTVSTPTDGYTIISRNCYIMPGAHIAHDCDLGEGVTLSAGVVLGGHVVIQPCANLGMNVCVHQRVKIGAASMVGAGSVVLYDVPCAVKVAGVPCRQIGSNTSGIDRLDEVGLGSNLDSYSKELLTNSGRLRKP